MTAAVASAPAISSPDAGPIAVDLDPKVFLGRWHIVATTLPFWRKKRGPVVTYTERSDGSWSDVLSWRSARGSEKWLAGVDHTVPGGRFVWRGSGFLRVLSSEWAFVASAPDLSWCATWFARASFGVTPEGMDVYARTPGDVRVADVLAQLATRPDLPALGAAWYETQR